MKNIEELKQYLQENIDKTIGKMSTPAGVDKQFRNRMFHNAQIFYSLQQEDGSGTLYSFYCNSEGNVITKEAYEDAQGAF